MGSQPHKSWQHFKLGLVLFAGGAGLILYGAQATPLLQLPGLILMLPGIFFAAKGYLGIFANRFAQTLKASERFRDQGK